MLRLYSDRDFFLFWFFGGGGLELWLFFCVVVFSSSCRLQYLYSVVVHLYPNLRVLFVSVKCDPLLYFSLFLLSSLNVWVTSVHSHVLELGRKNLNATSWCMSAVWCVLVQPILICNVVLPFLNTRLQILDNPRFLEKLLLWKHYVVLPCILLLRF